MNSDADARLAIYVSDRRAILGQGVADHELLDGGLFEALRHLLRGLAHQLEAALHLFVRQLLSIMDGIKDGDVVLEQLLLLRNFLEQGRAVGGRVVQTCGVVLGPVFFDALLAARPETFHVNFVLRHDLLLGGRLRVLGGRAAHGDRLSRDCH